MGTLQSAIGEGRQAGADEEGVPLEEVEKMQQEAMDGLRESLAKQITEVEEEISAMKSDIQRQGDVRLYMSFIAIFKNDLPDY